MGEKERAGERRKPPPEENERPHYGRSMQDAATDRCHARDRRSGQRRFYDCVSDSNEMSFRGLRQFRLAMTFYHPAGDFSACTVGREWSMAPF